MEQSGGFEGLAFPSLSLLCLFALGCGDSGLRGLASLGWLSWPGFGCPGCLAGTGFPSGNGPKRFLKKSVARDGKAVPINTQQRENPEAKQTNKENRMNTQHLQNAEASAFAAKQAAFRAYFSAAGTEAEAALAVAYNEAFHNYVVALDAWTAAKVQGISR